MSKTRDDLLKEIADGKKLMLICRMIQWLFWIAAAVVAIAASGGFWKWAGVAVCAAIGVFAWIFQRAAQEELGKTRGELDSLATRGA
jgi:membrane protein implicated in regulation of membrane protease activity